MNIPHVLIIITALSGFFLASYIRYKKHTAEHPFVCPIGADCHAVVHSAYSRFLSVPVEVLGILYYASIVLMYGALVAVPSVLSFSAVVGTGVASLALSAAAFFFSLYLTFVQAFLLRQWCTWCLISAGFCTIIFSLSFVAL